MANVFQDNFFLMNKGHNVTPQFNFLLRVEMLFDLPCKSVKAFTKENEYEYIQEGGLNDYVHMRRKPISKPFTFEVERYVGVDHLDPIPNGAELALPVLLIVSRVAHYAHTPEVWARTYAFTGCTVMKKQYGELNAEHSGLLTETTTIAFREMLCLDIPWTGAVSQKGWFDNKKPDAPSKPEKEKTEKEKSLEKEIKDLKNEKAELENKRAEQEKELKDLNKEKSNLDFKLEKNEITQEEYNTQKAVVDAKIQATKNNYTSTGDKLKEVNGAIKDKEKELVDHKIEMGSI
ncbi:MAG: hypothetical protein FWD34_01155 [Oscillospiraceae bacterium]|nr:hypothetical protein [Oscillospiraceae bacterium]